MRIKTILAVMLLAVTGQVSAQHVTYKSSKHYNEMVERFEKEPMPTSNNIVMLGDSHTEFGEDWNLRLESPYKIINRGIIGDDAKGIRHRLCQVCPGNPKIIFFECGANDLSHGLTVDQVASGVINTIKSIRKQAPNSKLIVQSMFPIDESFGRWKLLSGKTDLIPEINAKLQMFCQLNAIPYIDMFSLLKNPANNSMRKEYCKDGLHLLPAGYDVWAAEVQKYINLEYM